MLTAALPGQLDSALDTLFESGAAGSGGIAVDILAPTLGLHYQAARGEARPGQPMITATPVHWASVGKVFTACLTMRALELGLLGSGGLATPVADLYVLPTAVVASLNCLASPDNPLTVAQLLSHRGGLRDAMVDDARSLAQGGQPAAGSLLGQLLARNDALQHRHWDAWNSARPDDPLAGTLNFYLASGLGRSPVAPPGHCFHYSDTGYVILAVLLERLFDDSLHRLVRTQLLEPLAIDDCYLAYREDPPLGPAREPEADVWIGSTGLLSSGFNLSFDWGGGGWVSSASSMNRFLDGLFTGSLLSEQSLAELQAWSAPPGLARPRLAVGQGLFRSLLGDTELIGHGGAWGAKLHRLARAPIYFSGTVNQALAPPDWHLPLLTAVGARLGTTAGDSGHG